MEEQNKVGACQCPHHKMVPALVVLFGLVFLLKGLNVLSPNVTNVVWPVLVVLVGLMKMSQSKCKCC